MARVLLTTVCRPIGGPREGPSMGVDVMKGQLGLRQGVLRTSGTGQAYGLEYIAANVKSPTVVLHWPSRRELVRELRRFRPDFVGITFVFQLVPRLRDLVALVRRHAPGARVVLGGYGTAAEETHSLADHVCTGEGIAFMRELLGERVGDPIEHPTIVYGNRLLSLPVNAGRKLMICTGLGCATGCDFCATSYKFGKRYVPFVRDGDHMFEVMDDLYRRTGIDEFQVFDENFLVDEARARRLGDLCVARGRHFDFFTFASLQSLSRWSAEELVRIGISAVWVGLEGKKAGYGKLVGEDLASLTGRLRRAGILVVGSMIVGFDYHTAGIIREELAEILASQPTYLQCLQYGPTPGTTLHRRLEKEGRWPASGPPGQGVPHERCDGFELGFRHPHLSAAELSALQWDCYDRDLELLGHSIFRALEAWMEGWESFHGSHEPWLRARALVYEKKLRSTRPLLRVGLDLAPNREAVDRLATLRRRLDLAFGPPSIQERAVARVVLPVAAKLTAFLHDHDIFQQPPLLRRAWRV